MRENGDLGYFGKRAADEEAKSVKAASPQARNAHTTMARAYHEKVKGLREHASYTIVPKPD